MIDWLILKDNFVAGFAGLVLAYLLTFSLVNVRLVYRFCASVGAIFWKYISHKVV